MLKYTFLLFQLCVILEPMQELMSRHKAYSLNPRDCLKTTLFQKWQKMVAPPGKNTQTNKIYPLPSLSLLRVLTVIYLSEFLYRSKQEY